MGARTSTGEVTSQSKNFTQFLVNARSSTKAISKIPSLSQPFVLPVVQQRKSKSCLLIRAKAVLPQTPVPPPLAPPVFSLEEIDNANPKWNFSAKTENLDPTTAGLRV